MSQDHQFIIALSIVHPQENEYYWPLCLFSSHSYSSDWPTFMKSLAHPENELLSQKNSSISKN